MCGEKTTASETINFPTIGSWSTADKNFRGQFLQRDNVRYPRLWFKWENDKWVDKGPCFDPANCTQAETTRIPKFTPGRLLAKAPLGSRSDTGNSRQLPSHRILSAAIRSDAIAIEEKKIHNNRISEDKVDVENDVGAKILQIKNEAKQKNFAVNQFKLTIKTNMNSKIQNILEELQKNLRRLRKEMKTNKMLMNTMREQRNMSEADRIRGHIVSLQEEISILLEKIDYVHNVNRMF